MRASAVAVAIAIVAAALVAPTAATATPQQDAAAFAAVTTHATVMARGKDGDVRRAIADYFRSIRPCADDLPDLTEFAEDPGEEELLGLAVALVGLFDRIVRVTAPLEKRFAADLVAVRAQDPVLRRAAYAWRRRVDLTAPVGDGELLDVCTLLQIADDLPADAPELDDAEDVAGALDSADDDFERIEAGYERLVKLGVPEPLAERFVDPVFFALPRIDRAIERLFGSLDKTRQRELLRIR